MFFVLFFCGSILSSGFLFAGTLPFSVNDTNSTATVPVPKNVGRVIVESRDSGKSAWKVYKNLEVLTSPSTLQITLPPGFGKKSWRASYKSASVGSVRSKYPRRFFDGKKTFSAAVATSYAAGAQNPSSAPMVSLRTTAAPVALADAATSAASPTEAVEADIWKLEGSTAYYFNQHRGLQVIDLTDPSHPLLKAWYRLPAKGQDLYVLPEEGDVRHVLLLTFANDGSALVNLMKVEGSSVTLLSSLSVGGWIADSRMVGNRLYLATQNWGWSSDCVTTLGEILVDPASGTLSQEQLFPVSGSWPVISAGSDWLAVAASDWNDWQTSKVSLFSLSDSGAIKTADEFKLFGRVYDKDHMDCFGGRFSAVSERWVSEGQDAWWWNGTRVTTLQNFSRDGTPLASLEIQRGETLYSSKFWGDKAYVVTARQVDPLFVLDLSDATNPVLSGQLEVPGRSTRIVPFSSDRLFTIGFDGSNKVCASLFGVSDPANPSLLGRVSLGGTWGYSAATYDDKALKVLAEAGIALIPYTSWDNSWIAQQYVQILKIDPSAGTLSLGGAITNRFDPLRASVEGNTAVSISQKDLVTADISDPDAPSVLADLLLAWPVDRVLEASGHLLQISDGSSWYGNGPDLVVSSTSDPDTVIGEISLGEGTVRDASLFGNTLRILRQNDSSVCLDTYDLASLPDITPLGSATATLSQPTWNLQVGKMLFPSSDSVVSIVQSGSRWGYGWGYPIPIAIDPLPIRIPRVFAMASPAFATASSGVAPPPTASSDTLSVSSGCCIDFRRWWENACKSSPATAVIFGISNPAVPVVLPQVTLTGKNDGSIHLSEAGGGLLVVGYGEGETPSCWKRLKYSPVTLLPDGSISVNSTNSDYGLLSSAKHHIRILDLRDPSAPLLGPVQDLPGKLLAVSDLTRDGFLAWSEMIDSSRQIQVSACNGSTLSLIASAPVDFGAPMVASGRSFFTASASDSGSSVTRMTLTDAGSLQGAGSITLTWTPSLLRVAGSNLFGSDGGNLFNSSWNASGPLAPVNTWRATLGFEPSAILPLQDGSIAVPEGDYGVEVFNP